MVASTEEAVYPGAAGTEGFWRIVQRLAPYFYSVNSLLASNWAECLQRVIGTLTELVYCVGLRTNVAKMVSMDCQSCYVLRGQYLEAYGLQLTGQEITYWKRLCQRFHFPKCNADLAAESLASHRQDHHGVARGDFRETPPPPSPGDPRTYQITLPFRAETWFVTPRIGKTLGNFHHKVACSLEGMRPMLYTEVRWV